jgi:MFS family permease
MLGTFTGIFQSSIGLVSLPGPWIGAQLWERFNPRLPFLITGFVAFLTVIPAWFKFKLPEQNQKVPEEAPSKSHAVQKTGPGTPD